MKEIIGNLFDQKADAICITTNGFVKGNGRCVAGRGCAKTAKDKWPSFDLELGRNIRNIGNIPTIVLEKNNERPYTVISFPVKPAKVICEFDKGNIVSHMQVKFRAGQRVPGWAAKARMSIILDSAAKLVNLIDTLGYKEIILPRPGCGAGELDWNLVGPKLHRILDDRFSCITFK